MADIHRLIMISAPLGSMFTDAGMSTNVFCFTFYCSQRAILTQQCIFFLKALNRFSLYFKSDTFI